MKKVFKALGKSALYVLLFLGMQVIVSFVAIFAVYFELKLKNGGEISADEVEKIAELLTNKIMEMSLPISIISGLLTLVILIIFFAVRKKNILREVRFRKMSVGNAVLCFVLGIALNFAIATLIGLIPFPESWMSSYAESSSLLSVGNVWLMIIATVIVAPLVEETVFRGLAFTRLARAMPQTLALLIASAVFGIVHGSIIWFTYTFVLAIIMNFLYIRFRSLLAPILVHVGFNLVGTFMEFVDLESDLISLLYLIVSAICIVTSTAVIIIIARMTTENRVFVPDPEPVKKVPVYAYPVYQYPQYQPVMQGGVQQYPQNLQYVQNPQYVQYQQPTTAQGVYQPSAASQSTAETLNTVNQQYTEAKQNTAETLNTVAQDLHEEKIIEAPAKSNDELKADNNDGALNNEDSTEKSENQQ